MKKRLNGFQIALRGIVVALIVLAVVLFAARAEETTIRCWVMCQPGDRVNLRMGPSKNSRSVGWLECGDGFQTDGESRNGWIRVLDAGDCECWIYCGYVVTEEPEAVFENYVVVAKNKLACRRWVDGPQVTGREWLKNGTSVQVFYTAEGWAVTNLGYMKTEWLEVDPL